MTVAKTLRQKIAPELTYLYTVPPHQTPQGADCGWYGREVGLHTFFAARLLGVAAELRTGDFAVLSRDMPPVTTLDTGLEHAWCSVEGIAPVDLSMTFAYFGRVPQLKHPIVGEGANGDWQVRYAKDDSLLDEKVEQGNEILFIERKTHAYSEKALLDNPYLFLPPPQIGDTQSWHAFFGPDIYAKISLHCFRCVADPGRSVQNKMTRPQAVGWIAQNYPAPEAQITEALKPVAAP